MKYTMTLLGYITLFVLFNSCAKTKKREIPDCNTNFKQVYFTPIFKGIHVKYTHVLLMKEFDYSFCFTITDFIKIVDEYRDTCKTSLPIGEVLFISSEYNCGFEDHELNWGRINKNEIVSLYFNPFDSTNSFPLTAISFPYKDKSIYFNLNSLKDVQ